MITNMVTKSTSMTKMLSDGMAQILQRTQLFLT